MPEQQLIALLASVFVLGLIAGLLLSSAVQRLSSWSLNQLARFRYIRLHRKQNGKVKPS